MTAAAERFTIQIDALSAILSKTKNQREKGKYFYRNKARDVLFRLEALCRLYREIHDKKLFDAWYKKFKALEDVLGVMDYHESLYLEFTNYRELKKQAEKIYLGKFEEESQYLTEILREEGWLAGTALNEFREIVNHAEWKPEAEDALAYGLVMCSELDKVVNRYSEGELSPFKLEEGVHEFRRRIRWVSIYASASNGLVQLRKNDTLQSSLKTYCTPQVIASPFNTMPKQKGLRYSIVIQAPAFYALSWMINELGTLKDDGFRYENLLSLINVSGKDQQALRKKFMATYQSDPVLVCENAERLMDEFIYRDMIPERIRRDIKRSF
jgi:hypothetical protein